VAEAVQRSIRRSDLCGRFGGEEFAVVCPYHGIEGAAVLAERLRCAVAAEPVVAEGVTINVTISAGVAERQAGQIKPEQMLECADEMLYAAKNNGRNQVWLAVGASEGRPLHGEPAAGTGPPSSASPPRSDAAPPISGFIVAREQAPA
jgi:predicted signal transduction protein with EAL and GGDEF domain